MSPELADLYDKAVEEDNPIVKETLMESVVKKQAQHLIEERVIREEAAAAGPIVSVKPWMARKQPGKNGGTLYESEAVLERVWDDGTTDYVCSICEYESENPRGVAAHYGKAHTLKGQVPPASQDGPHTIDPSYTEPTTTRDYRPTERMVDTLMSVLDDILNETADMRETALRLLTWMHDRPDIDHTERPLAPLTDKDILNRIRVLVGQPDQSEEIAALQGKNTELANEVARLKQEKAALRDLLTEE
jgi:hypothetical protein